MVGGWLRLRNLGSSNTPSIRSSGVATMSMRETVPRVLRVLDFGRSLVPYGRSLRLQELLFNARRSGSIEDTLILLQVG